ncbi:hypothetical protein J3L16_03255 [Alteromonas sp. 5E99-2]|uniref:hypothetical protein n=1 Tax=Alteromonas sp. 5E99-2 TaxID=2817683 RepID=UPI001A990C87|nr:hypothetical protein [Alteromonas sp. 5E99-2]MBO1254702.1 hypothetical protein [Alteromonas sp. 5E99-2]
MTHDEIQNPQITQRLEWSLLALRVSIFVVIFVWSLDKFFNPGHASKIFEIFYGVQGVAHTLVYVLGAIQVLLALAFLAGFQKRITYGAIFLLHGASTLSSFPQYFDPFNNLLFFAAWPMWGACFALFMLRALDTKFTVSAK